MVEVGEDGLVTLSELWKSRADVGARSWMGEVLCSVMVRYTLLGLQRKHSSMLEVWCEGV